MTNVMAFHGADSIRAKIIVEDIVLEKASNLQCLCYSVTNMTNNDAVRKLQKFNHMSETIRRTLKSTRKESRPTVYKVMALFMGLTIRLE